MFSLFQNFPRQCPSAVLLRLALVAFLCVQFFSGPDAVAKIAGKRLLLFVGSNTLGERAVPELAKAYLEKMKNVSGVTISHQGEVVYVSGKLPDGTTVYIEIHATGSGDCFRSFLGKYPALDEPCDIGMSSRRIKKEELEALQKKTGMPFSRRGTEPGDGSEHPVAVDGLTIIVPRSNPLNRISFGELKAIYSRKVTQWNQLSEWSDSGGGKEPLAIVPARRKEPSGTLDVFKERIEPEGPAMSDVLQVPAFVSSTELATSVAANPGGIGFVGRSYVKQAELKRLQVYDDTPRGAMRPEDATFPDPATIQSQTYPLSRLVFLYTSLFPLNDEVKPFIRFALGEEGQAVIAEKGNLFKVEGTAEHITKKPEIGAPATKPAKPAAAAENVILRLHGSNTVGAECTVNLAYCFLTAKKLARNPIAKIEDRTATIETPEGEKALEHDLLCDLDGDGVREVIEIRPTGSSDAFRALFQGLCDIGMSSRPITDAEKRDLLPICGNLGLPSAQFALGLDAFAIIVSNDNPVEKLTIEQVRRIFLGEITDWSQVGGEKKPIQLHARPDRSGTYRRFCDAVLLGRQVAPSAIRHPENSSVTEAVLRDPAGIGFGPMANVGLAKSLRIGHEGSENFYKPTEEAVRSGRYPTALRRHIYLYIPTTPPGILSPVARRNWTAAREFAELSQTWLGQALVEGSGFIPETVTTDAAGHAKRLDGEPVERFIQRLRDLEKNAQTAKGGFRPRLDNDEICPQLLFDFNDWILTAESRNIIDRKLGPWLKMYPQVAQAGLIVEGWADSMGTDEACIKVSLQRAQIVSKYLTETLGCKATAIGRGKSFDPPNTNEVNKQQNRRVVIKAAPGITTPPTPSPTPVPQGKKKR